MNAEESESSMVGEKAKMNAEEDRGKGRGDCVDSDAGAHAGIDQPLRRRPLVDVPDGWNVLTRQIIGCSMEVHSVLGPGLLERLYEEALVHELRAKGLDVKQQYEVIVDYKGVSLRGQRLDMVVQDLVVIELKAVDEVANAHLAQLVSYLRAAGLPLGLLINFNSPRLKDGIYRRLNERAFAATLTGSNPNPHS